MGEDGDGVVNKCRNGKGEKGVKLIFKRYRTDDGGATERQGKQV